MDEPRTESATPRKLARARRQGVVPKSPDLIAAAVLLALLGSLADIGAPLLRALSALLTSALQAAASPTPPGIEQLALPLREVAALALVPLLAVAAAAVLGNLLQVGPLFAPAGVAPDLRRIDPGARLAAMFSPWHWGSALIALAKACAVLAIAAWVVLDARRALATLGAGDAARAAAVLCAVVGRLVACVAALALLLGAADLVLRRVQHARALRMSRRELRDEQRETSGLPEHRELRRRRHAQLWAERALEEASVLLVDGRQRALALAYDAAVDAAPRVAFKAQGQLALDARARAERGRVPTRVEPALVAALFPLELTELVPRAQHAAVAELMRDLIARGDMPAPAVSGATSPP